METELAANDADDPGSDRTYALETYRDTLWGLIDYAVDRAQREDIHLRNRLLFTFGSGPLAPTLMGELSWYHERHEAYVEVLGPETFAGPRTWRERALQITLPEAHVSPWSCRTRTTC